MSNGRHRRGSRIGGVVLVLLGVVFLLHNFRPDIRVWAYFERWWPVLLIVWGVARLIENMVARRSGQAPGPVLTGGEFFVLLLVLGAAGAISLGHRVIPGIHFPGDMGEDLPFGVHTEVTEELPALKAQSNSLISIETNRGDISVHASDDDEIRVVVKKTAFAFDEDSANKLARASRVSLTQTSRGYEVRPQIREGSFERVRLNLEIHVPRNSPLELKSQYGNLSVEDAGVSVSATTRRGTVEIRQAGGDVRAETLRGDIRIVGAKGNVHVSGRGSEVEVADVGGDATIEGEFFGPIRVRNVPRGTRFVSARTDLTLSSLPGQMEMDSGDLRVDDASGNILLTTREKDVVMENISGKVRIENKHGEVTVRMRKEPKDEISISNESGGVELSLPSRATFEVDASSRSGEIANDFEDSELKLVQNDNGNSSLHGKHGQKGPRINLQTTYGQIRLRKSD